MQRVTKQRKSVEDCLGKFSTFLSIQEIHTDLVSSGQKIGLSTVYRIIGEMYSDKSVDMILSESNESLYRLCSKAHHHHLVCNDCGTAVEVFDETIENWANQIAKANKFKLVDHQVELTGTCAKCA